MNKTPNVLVIGDTCKDVFIYGECNRLSPEAPVPVFNPIKTVENNGMAGGVADILRYLGCNVFFHSNTNKITKTRYIDDKTDHYFLRVDENDESHQISNSRTLENFIQTNVGSWDRIDYIVISDYNKGFVTSEVIKYVSNLYQLSFLDTKKKIDSWAGDIDFIKVNEKEYNANINYLSGYQGNLITTLGANGVRYKEKVIPVENKQEIFELSAAGDVFHACFSYGLWLSNNIEKSIKFANSAASYHVSKRGTNFISKGFNFEKELLDLNII